MGARVQAYIQLNKVLLGYELWRELNGFPIAINNKNNNTTLNSNSIFNDDYDKKKGGGKYDK